MPIEPTSDADDVRGGGGLRDRGAVVNLQRPGCDLESRAQLRRLERRAGDLHQFLSELVRESPAAASRIGITDETVSWVNQLAGRAYWASTADLFQRGEDEFARRVIARAEELEEQS
ncbi:hypothetical protein PP568_06690 [Mycobacteroides abscessus]|uniref:hypothetical protein n=2 Tax=Mycobacteroides abscessus TaxID=36809 RepID=UPI000FEB9246|nr:hypothetical protein [Mycobacteroides abscessus]MBN7463497.1 hypothetical protein [Mycobacteroides abscessus subsp. abscessus]MBN7555225.1 hypothetical protein [Mycobacteroides abscessus subsp. abscessus]MDM2404617.1 hypothetical protein [Mycobacteroides abscessus]MDM2414335.1 hypothetical protein [Mycobacteroides abscessus]MDO3011890.1 hypothetical protein [Mycobacteroides abscessus subsp. abscessus]